METYLFHESPSNADAAEGVKILLAPNTGRLDVLYDSQILIDPVKRCASALLFTLYGPGNQNTKPNSYAERPVDCALDQDINNPQHNCHQCDNKHALSIISFHMRERPLING